MLQKKRVYCPTCCQVNQTNVKHKLGKAENRRSLFAFMNNRYDSYFTMTGVEVSKCLPS